MLFDIGAGEVLGLAILGMLLVGPERLPKLAVEAAQWIKKIRNLATTATAELRENLGPGFEDLQPQDLNPKTFLRKQVADLLDEEKHKPTVNRPVAMIDPDLL
ncbi:MAG: Sec-independent protein secretion pathway component [Actinobacteria bacterium]|nr:Sec-independent protein secretion pathway component [Actinomycetota bacterium]